MKQRLPLARTDLVWCCPERPVNHYVLPFSHVILDLVLVRYERGAEVRNPFRQSSWEVMIKDTAIKPKGSGHDIV